MKLFSIFMSASIISMVVGSTPQQLQPRELDQHLVVNKRATLHSHLTSASPRMLHKRHGRALDCSGRKKKPSHHHSKASGKSGGVKSGSESSSATHDDESSSNGTKSTGKGKSSSRKSSGKNNSDSGDASSAKGTSSGTSSSSSGTGLAGKTFSGRCKDPNASSKYPNGDIHFLNCGISKSDKSSKWSPPKLTMDDITTISGDEAAKSSVFEPCRKYKSLFEKAEKSSGIAAVMLMAFAMQESTCNPSETGGNGERGIMQLTPDKCGGVDCYDAGTNIMMGAKYFKSQVDQFNGNVLQAVGAYNGWSSDMSFNSATNQQWGCTAQNNLDYLNSFFNAWIQGKNGYSKEFLLYDNLANCPN